MLEAVQLKELFRVAAEQLLLLLRREYLSQRRQSVAGLLAVGKVAGKHQHFIGPELINNLRKLSGRRRTVERFNSHANVLPDVFRRRFVEPGNLSTMRFPLSIELPHQRWHPGHAALHEREPQLRKLVEDALRDETYEVTLKELGASGRVFEDRREVADWVEKQNAFARLNKEKAAPAKA